MTKEELIQQLQNWVKNNPTDAKCFIESIKNGLTQFQNSIEIETIENDDTPNPNTLFQKLLKLKETIEFRHYPSQIMAIVAEEYKLDINLLKETPKQIRPSVKSKVVKARQIIIFLLYHLTALSIPEIQKFMNYSSNTPRAHNIIANALSKYPITQPYYDEINTIVLNTLKKLNIPINFTIDNQINSYNKQQVVNHF
jgi:hypothetical protein